MKLLDYTTTGGFLPHLKCATVEDAVRRLVGVLADAGEVRDAAGVVAEVMRREAEGSTAIGGGLVIPHARHAAVPEVRVAVATLAAPLDVPSEDGQPVDVVILLVGPDGDPRQMLRVLARLARAVKSGDYIDGLRRAVEAPALRDAFARAL
ncbi:MAG TPA: PTS sugar transporter subunit IIA [Candidatus Krumholzibacteria bacterium]|nr:PTS sugar transporter subunit IIA [Candidatus Krumholzibacteria bacterium]